MKKLMKKQKEKNKQKSCFLPFGMEETLYFQFLILFKNSFSVFVSLFSLFLLPIWNRAGVCTLGSRTLEPLVDKDQKLSTCK